MQDCSQRCLPEYGVRSVFKRVVIRFFSEMPEVGQHWRLTVGHPLEDGYSQHHIIVREICEQYQRIHFEIQNPRQLRPWNSDDVPKPWGWLSPTEFVSKRIYGVLERIHVA
jgi:hypothetical protein